MDKTERYWELAELTKARLREFYREPGAIFWVFGFPLLLAIGLGIAFRHRPPDKPRIAVEDTADAAWAKAILQRSEVLDVQVMPSGEARGALASGQIDLMVETIEPTRVTYRYDSTRDEARLARLLVDKSLQVGMGRQDPVQTHEQLVTEPGSRYIDFLIPGILGLNLMGSSMWGIGYTIVVNRKRRLLKRLAASPMRRINLMLGYIFARLVFLVAEVAALVSFGWLFFDVNVQGSWFDLALVSLFGAACFAGMSLLIAARTESLEAVSGWMNFVMLPMWLLSGSFFSYERFPEIMHPVIRLLPLTALNDALRAIFSQGQSFLALGSELAILGCVGIACMLLATRYFRWQ